MSTFAIRRRDSKTGNKRDKVVRKLSSAEVRDGQWGRAATGAAHHFYIDGTSVCGRPIPAKAVADATRKLCPECYAAVHHAAGLSPLDGF